MDSSEDEQDGPSDIPSVIATQLQLFTPKLDYNVFPLSHGELEMLRLPLCAVGSSLLLMTPGQSIFFVGAAYITLLQGAITLLGTEIAPSLQAHRVFSPRSSPLVSLEAMEPQPSSDSPPSLLDGTRLPQKIQTCVVTSHSILIIQRMQTGVEGLGNVCRTFSDVFRVDSAVDTDDIGVEGFRIVNPYTRPHPQLHPFFLPESWKKALDTTIPPLEDEVSTASPSTSLIALVRGPKKCGKSTFARTLLNRLTTRYRHVAFLECDLGQSEFTPGGMVSLHVISRPVFGPPFTHPRLPYRAHYIGHTTPHSSPSHYVSCIQALVQTYRMDIQYSYQEISAANEGDTENDNRTIGLVPLVVNTQGWLKGLGGVLLQKIEEIIGPTQIFDLDIEAVLPPQRRMDSSTTCIHALQPIPPSPLAAYYTPADHRALAILSYFHCVFPAQNTAVEDVRWDTDLPLCARLPWAVDCREAFDHIVLIGAGYEDVVPDELTHAINCGVVGLVCDEEEPSAILERTIESFPYSQGAPPPDPSISHCVGLALVRGVDATTYTLHVLTPIFPRELTRCRVLVKGELELPVWGMLDFRQGQDGVAGLLWGKVPYLQMGGRRAEMGTAAAGAGRRRVRRNLMRKSQM